MSDIKDNTEHTAELTVEESFQKLDRMAEMLESDGIGLEESFKLYEEGMKLLKDLHERIEDYEKKMLVHGYASNRYASKGLKDFLPCFEVPL